MEKIKIAVIKVSPRKYYIRYVCPKNIHWARGYRINSFFLSKRQALGWFKNKHLFNTQRIKYKLFNYDKESLQKCNKFLEIT